MIFALSSPSGAPTVTASAPAAAIVQADASVSASAGLGKKELSASSYGPMTDPENVEAYVSAYFSDTPILAKIAGCESHYRQYNSAGNVLRGEVNKYDVGVMQINELYHADEAKALGYDIYSVDGNAAFGRYLYEKYGTKPWASSSACWTKSTNPEIAKA